MKKSLFLMIGLLCTAPLALAQTSPTLTFSAATTTGNGSVVPVLTWSTAPAATSCTASGDAAWTGTKPASGTVTLAAATASKTYNLACTWPGKSSINVSWTAPTKNTDGSELTDLKGFKLYYSTSPSMSVNTVKDIAGPSVKSTSVTGVAPGTYYVVMSAYNAADVESDKSPVVSVVVPSGASVTRSVGIVVNPVPMSPFNITATAE